MIAEMKAGIQENVAKTNKRRKPIGGDGVNFEMTIDLANGGVYLDKTPIKNHFGQKYGEVEVDKGKIHISVSLPKYLRDNNITPFGIADFDSLKSLVNDLKHGLNSVLAGLLGDDADVMDATAKSIECNITLPVVGKATCSQVLNLINRAHVTGTNVVYQRASNRCIYDKENETVIIKKKNNYTLKCYDKSLQQSREGHPVESGLLRIEIVMQDRVIKRLFGNKSTIRDILTKQGLMKIIAEYKRIFTEDIMSRFIYPCLKEVATILYSTLRDTGSQLETIALHKTLIMDEMIFRKALERWYKVNGFTRMRARQNTATYISRNKEKYGFPENVIGTLKEFEKLCK